MGTAHALAGCCLRQVTIMPEETPLGDRSMGIARALCRLLRLELPLEADRERSRLTRPADRREGLLRPYTHLCRHHCSRETWDSPTGGPAAYLRC